MNTIPELEELAFINLQLAGLLRTGVPLEGSLKHLCTHLRQGRLRGELELLEQDLREGIPLAKAVEKRKLPLLYRQILGIGARSNALPDLLLLLADYYQEALLSWRRLQAMLVYPAIVLVLACLLSIWFGFLTQHFYLNESGMFSPLFGEVTLNPTRGDKPRQVMNVWEWRVHSWAPPTLLVAVTAAYLAGMALPGVRRSLQWRISPFREASLSRFASSMHLLLKVGCPLPDAVRFMAEVEQGSSAGVELEGWSKRLAEGHTKWAFISRVSIPFQPLFLWIVATGGQDLCVGFGRAAELYRQRALHVRDVVLYAAMPACLLFLGLMIGWQIYPFMAYFASLTRILG